MTQQNNVKVGEERMWKSKIDEYGNLIVQHTHAFITGKINEKKRDMLYAGAGEILLMLIGEGLKNERQKALQEAAEALRKLKSTDENGNYRPGSPIFVGSGAPLKNEAKDQVLEWGVDALEALKGKGN